MRLSEGRHTPPRPALWTALVTVLLLGVSVVIARQDTAPERALVGRSVRIAPALAAAPAPAPAPVVLTPVVAPPAGPVGPCAEALAWVAKAGLRLPPGAGYQCPSAQFAHHGVACSYAAQCPGSRYIAINIALMGDVTPEYLRHVVAHEVCHLLHFDAGRESTEAQADDCAAAYGAPRVPWRPEGTPRA